MTYLNYLFMGLQDILLRVGHISLKVPNVEFEFEFDFNVCVDSIQFLTRTS